MNRFSLTHLLARAFGALASQRTQAIETVATTVLVNHPHGIFCRSARALADLARSFAADTKIRRQAAPAASAVALDDVLGVLLLGIPFGECVCLTAMGPQAQAAVDAAAQLVIASPQLFPLDPVS